jgi:flagellin-specific chaperone FliS
MTLAAHTRGQTPEKTASLQPGASTLSHMLVTGALRCIELARECVARGDDPRRHLRSASLRIRELPATLEMPANHPMAVSFADLCDYICRKLREVADTQGLSSLDDTSDLLREIGRAWVTLPARGITLQTAVCTAAEL